MTTTSTPATSTVATTRPIRRQLCSRVFIASSAPYDLLANEEPACSHKSASRQAPRDASVSCARSRASITRGRDLHVGEVGLGIGLAPEADHARLRERVVRLLEQ